MFRCGGSRVVVYASGGEVAPGAATIVPSYQEPRGKARCGPRLTFASLRVAENRGTGLHGGGADYSPSGGASG